VTFVRAIELVRERAGEADAYPWSLPVVRGLERLELDPAVTFLVGENGSGKSTLVEALATAGARCTSASRRVVPRPGQPSLLRRRALSFDEPEAALSPHGLLALMRRMSDFVAERSQFVIATHSPILMAFPGATIYECTPDGLQRVAYDDLDHVRLTRSFLEDPQCFLRHLFAD
jgi:predicted ATPase